MPPHSLVRAPSSIKFSRTQACPVHCSRQRNQRRPLINALLRYLLPNSSYLSPAKGFPSAFPTLSPHCYKHRLPAPTLSTTEGNERHCLPLVCYLIVISWDRPSAGYRGVLIPLEPPSEAHGPLYLNTHIQYGFNREDPGQTRTLPPRAALYSPRKTHHLH